MLTSIYNNITDKCSSDDDSEYTPKTNCKTIPITVQSTAIINDFLVSKIYLHPNNKLNCELRHDVFKSPYMKLDLYGYEWRWSFAKAYNTKIFEANIFRSLKDIEFQFIDEQLYRYAVLPYIEKTRRYRISKNGKDYVIIKRQNGERLQCKFKDEKGIDRWLNVAIQITDVSAMMGVGSLKDYGINTGLEMANKDNFTSEDKSHIADFYPDANRFDLYAISDTVDKLVTTKEVRPVLTHIKEAVCDHINKIALMLGIEPVAPSEGWGMSTGTIVARLISNTIAKKVGVTVEQLHELTKHGGQVGILDLGRLLKKKDNFIYLSMVCGGRANTERLLKPGSKVSTSEFINRKVKGVYTGILCDIDISGCYANGLMNQSFPIGIPQVLSESMSLKTFIDKVLPRCVSGCWNGRIDWVDAPFEQDLLVSKVPEKFTDWDWGVDGHDNDGFEYDPDNKTYDASMLVSTRSVHQASINHDLLQTLKSVASKKEWEWLQFNATVTGVIYYDVNLRVNEVTTEMLSSMEISDESDTVVKGCKKWVEVKLSEIMEILIPERAKAKRIHGKKSSEQTFLKLVNNCIYGVIASAFFNRENACISNVVVGNNITARARCLAWLMAKGLGTFQSVTDGGVFDLNNVIYWKRISLHNLSRLYYDEAYDDSKHQTFTKKPLLDKVLTENVIEGFKGWQSDLRKSSDFNDKFDVEYLQDNIDQKAWSHLKNQFKNIDILKEDQFTFESKRICLGFTPHNKVNYRLHTIVEGDNKGEEYFIAVRGMNLVEDENGKKVVNPTANLLFDNYEDNIPYAFCLMDTKLLSLKDWRKLRNSNPEKYYKLLPDDQVSDNKTFYSITPLNYRFKDLYEYRSILDIYQRAKDEGDYNKIASISIDKKDYSKAIKKINKLKR